jgi:hypothetical protein
VVEIMRHPAVSGPWLGIRDALAPRVSVRAGRWWRFSFPSTQPARRSSKNPSRLITAGSGAYLHYADRAGQLRGFETIPLGRPAPLSKARDRASFAGERPRPITIGNLRARIA